MLTLDSVLEPLGCTGTLSDDFPFGLPRGRLVVVTSCLTAFDKCFSDPESESEPLIASRSNVSCSESDLSLVRAGAAFDLFCTEEYHRVRRIVTPDETEYANPCCLFLSTLT